MANFDEAGKERKLFGKTIRDLQAQEVKRLTVQAQRLEQNLPMESSTNFIVSELRPQASIYSYQSALGLTRDASEQALRNWGQSTTSLKRDNSTGSVASQGGERDSSLIAKRTNGRAAYDSSNQSNRLNFLETRKVD